MSVRIVSIAVALFIPSVLGITICYVCRGDLGQTIITYFTAAFLAFPLSLALVVYWIAIRLNKVKKRRAFGVVLAITFSVYVFLFILVKAAPIFRRAEISEAREFVKNVEPVLDEYKEKSGRYPDSLREIGIGKLPRLLDAKYFYHTSGDEFTFWYHVHNTILGEHQYSSEVRKWE